MAWPFYALVAVNQRARLGPPLGDRTDTYLENIIKNRTIPCFVFQGTVLVTGLALILLRGMGLDTLVTIPVLSLKFFLLSGVGGFLADPDFADSVSLISFLALLVWLVWLWRLFLSKKFAAA